MNGRPGGGDARAREHEVLRQYREELESIDEAEATLVNETNDGLLMERLNRAEKLMRTTEDTPSKAELDSTLMLRLTGIFGRRVQQVDPSQFQPLLFADRLAAAVSDQRTPGADGWASLGQMGCALLRPAPGLRALLGSLPAPDAPPPERRPRAPRAKRTPLAAAVAPDRVTEVAVRKDETRFQVNRLLAVLRGVYSKRREPIGFYEFAYHPTDFGATVENVFHTAHLVRQRLARISLHGGLPVIEPVEPGSSSARADAQAHQLLMRVDHETWRSVVRDFGIRSALVQSEQQQAAAASRRGAADSAAPPAKRRT